MCSWDLVLLSFLLRVLGVNYSVHVHSCACSLFTKSSPQYPLALIFPSFSPFPLLSLFRHLPTSVFPLPRPSACGSHPFRLETTFLNSFRRLAPVPFIPAPASSNSLPDPVFKTISQQNTKGGISGQPAADAGMDVVR